jgi:hypothetical protein
MAGEDRKTIDDIVRTLTNLTITGSERVPGRDGAGDFKTTLNYLRQWMAEFFPAGTPSRIIPGQFTLSYVDTATIAILPGSVIDDTFTFAITLSSLFSKTTGAFAEGDTNGALDTGAIGASKTYDVYAISKTDGQGDYLMCLRDDAPVMPADFVYKRYIGCIITDASAHIINFYQHGNMFRFDAQILDKIYANLANTDRNLLTVSIPENCIGIFNLRCAIGSANPYYLIAQAVEETDIQADIGHHTFSFAATADYFNIETQIFVNGNRQIAYRGNSTNIGLQVKTIGFIDPLI